MTKNWAVVPEVESCLILITTEKESKAMRVMTCQQQRDHKAMLWRNIRRALRECHEHGEMLQRVFAPMLCIKLPRIPRHQP